MRRQPRVAVACSAPPAAPAWLRLQRGVPPRDGAVEIMSMFDGGERGPPRFPGGRSPANSSRQLQLGRCERAPPHAPPRVDLRALVLRAGLSQTGLYAAQGLPYRRTARVVATGRVFTAAEELGRKCGQGRTHTRVGHGAARKMVGWTNQCV